MRTAILEIVRSAKSPMTVAELADATGIPQTTVRFHLRSLVADGLVDSETAQHRGPGRPRLLYRPKAAMDPSGPRNYELLAEVLTEALASVPDAERCAERAGRIWGEQCAPHGVDPIADLLVVLGDFGFAPEATDSGIRLNRCPFLELARDHPGVTCAVHLGIMQGVLASHASPVHLAGLEAFVDADHCFATVTTGGRP